MIFDRFAGSSGEGELDAVTELRNQLAEADDLQSRLKKLQKF